MRIANQRRGSPFIISTEWATSSNCFSQFSLPVLWSFITANYRRLPTGNFLVLTFLVLLWYLFLPGDSFFYCTCNVHGMMLLCKSSHFGKKPHWNARVATSLQVQHWTRHVGRCLRHLDVSAYRAAGRLHRVCPASLWRGLRSLPAGTAGCLWGEVDQDKVAFLHSQYSFLCCPDKQRPHEAMVLM